MSVRPLLLAIIDNSIRDGSVSFAGCFVLRRAPKWFGFPDAAVSYSHRERERRTLPKPGPKNDAHAIPFHDGSVLDLEDSIRASTVIFFPLARTSFRSGTIAPIDGSSSLRRLVAVEFNKLFRYL